MWLRQRQLQNNRQKQHNNLADNNFRAGRACRATQQAGSSCTQQTLSTASADAVGDSLATHRRGVLQGLLGTAALTSLSTPPSSSAAASATQQSPAATQPPSSTAAGPCCTPAQPGCNAAATTAEASAAEAASSSACCLQPCTAAAAARDPTINLGCATAGDTRRQLAGLIPPRQVNLSVEVMRAQAAMQQCSTDLEKHRVLIALKETNRAAFISLLQSDLEGLLPLVYTPVIAEACLNWGTLVPRPMGLYIGPEDDPLEVMTHWPSQEVRVAVITDGQRVLGLGDLGAHGMGIPTGKSNVYFAAGTPPDWLLPVTVDVGTDNASLPSDPLYVGHPEQRLRGPRYFTVMEGVVKALQQRYGRRVVVHWEDLAMGNALQMLQRTESLGLPTFNDDIQCTAAVALAALLGATAVPGVLPLQAQTFCFFGAGQANLGVAQLLVRALQKRGLSEAAAKARIWMVDSKGLITTDRPSLTPQKAAFAQDASRINGRLSTFSGSSGSGSNGNNSNGSSSSSRRPSKEIMIQQLTSIVEAVQPTALIGAAAVGGAFGRPVLQALVKATKAAGGASARPLVFALSNPTNQAEVSFADALKWTSGAAVYASGSPFAPVPTATGRVLRPAQANNCFVFPGLAQGILDSGRRRVDERLLLVAAEAIAGMLTHQEVEEECVLPRIARLPEVTQALAAAVARAR